MSRTARHHHFNAFQDVHALCVLLLWQLQCYFEWGLCLFPCSQQRHPFVQALCYDSPLHMYCFLKWVVMSGARPLTCFCCQTLPNEVVIPNWKGNIQFVCNFPPSNTSHFSMNIRNEMKSVPFCAVL